MNPTEEIKTVVTAIVRNKGKLDDINDALNQQFPDYEFRVRYDKKWNTYIVHYRPKNPPMDIINIKLTKWEPKDDPEDPARSS
jgi:endonuclease V-like protein UPF0215 family